MLHQLQTLSFTTKNGGSQTKLVWSQGAHGPSKKNLE